MRFGSPWVGGFEGRAMVPQGFRDPLITNFQRKPHTRAQRPKKHLVTPCAQQRGGGYEFLMYVYEKLNKKV